MPNNNRHRINSPEVGVLPVSCVDTITGLLNQGNELQATAIIGKNIGTYVG